MRKGLKFCKVVDNTDKLSNSACVRHRVQSLYTVTVYTDVYVGVRAPMYTLVYAHLSIRQCIHLYTPRTGVMTRVYTDVYGCTHTHVYGGVYTCTHTSRRYT